MSRQAARASPLNPTKAHASALFYLRKKPLTADAKPLRILSCGEQIQRDEQAGKTALLCTSIKIFSEQRSVANVHQIGGLYEKQMWNINLTSQTESFDTQNYTLFFIQSVSR